MHEQPTCGKGLAENATLPAAVAELMDATVLEAHVGTLDPADASARREEDAYRGLVDEHRTIARALRAAAARLTGYRDLPMGRHDPAAMAAPSRMRTFETFRPRLSEGTRALQHVFLAHIDPVLGREVLEQLSRPRLVLAAPMTYWLQNKRAELLETLTRVRILIISEGVAREVSGEALTALL